MTGQDYELGPLPQFASAWAHGVIGPGVALATRDGRVCGNAYVNGSALGTRGGFEVVTEAGNTMVLTEAEINELFYPPRWVLNHKRFAQRAEQQDPIGAALEPNSGLAVANGDVQGHAIMSAAMSLKRIADAMQAPNEYGEIGGAAIAGAIFRALRDSR